MLLMPTFSIPLSPDDQLYGHGIIPITGYIGMNVLILLIGLIIDKRTKLTLFIFSLLLFVIHPGILYFFTISFSYLSLSQIQKLYPSQRNFYFYFYKRIMLANFYIYNFIFL